MFKKLLYLIVVFLIGVNSNILCQTEEYLSPTIESESVYHVKDGPYIFYVNDSLKIKWINNNRLREGFIVKENFAEIAEKFKLQFSYNDLKNSYIQSKDYSQVFTDIDSIAVITDIHGEYKAYISLLRACGIIDKDLNWSFGKGHFVVLGDIFDRGDKVTETLWHLFGLVRQAEAAGGKVHVMIGNHEIMVLAKDLRYINKKYQKVETVCKTDYNELYSENSVLGKWIRSLPVVITINDILFVHGGMSIELLEKDLDISQINHIYSNKIIGKEYNPDIEDKAQLFLDGVNGPVWYRGYFNDPTFCESRLDSILDFYKKEHIVVGHTVIDEITPLFNNKIFGVDAGMMIEKPGELLIYKEGTFYRGTKKGKREKL